MKEIWKPVKGYEKKYAVSSLANIRNIITGQVIKQRIGADGYVRCVLSKDGVQKQCFVHRLVASAFVCNIQKQPEVNHKDEDKSNNRPENLEWCTHKYNSNFGSRLMRMAKTNYKPVIQLDKQGNEIARYESQKEAMECTGINGNHISCCCKGKRKTSGGYIWRYDNLIKEAISAQ